ncbi:serine hydrolase [Devosia sp. ZB163]|uniref:serine hydrolase domain-containing protein n=1 Tax=Devosia sp. ZB163 TaxID=3025938 RepID=UPI00235E2806|nr:serine hydrolase domain-containing protein [Devosia sp. ZB163]MDC9823885.1 serine hydrolase [Devosia sp. ZB163]
MTALYRLAGASLVVLASCLPALAADDVSGVLEGIRAKYQLPGISVAMMKDGEILASGAAGTRVLDMDIPVTVEDRFHIGSDTKAMTAVIAGTLVDEGKLKWDSTIGEVLGDEIKDMNPKLAAVTLEQLLSHSSGIPSDTDEMIKIYFNADAFQDTAAALRLKAIETMKGLEPKVPEGSPFQYANFGYLIAGAMIEKAAGKPWEQLIHERIFEPLGLKSAGLGAPATDGLYDAAVGTRINDDGSLTAIPWGVAAGVPPVVAPAGDAHMSVLDFAKWGDWNATGGKSPTIVKPETLAEILKPRVTTPPLPDPPPGTPGQGEYAFGWGVVNYDWTGHPVLTHNGSNSMNLAKILVDTETGVTIAAVTNLPGKDADAALNEAVETLYEQQAK